MLETILDTPIHGWMCKKDDAEHIVLSSRIRLARNFKDVPFTSFSQKESLKKVNQMMRKTVPNLVKVDGQEYSQIDLEKLSPLERAILVEKHLMSPKLGDNPEERSLIVSENGDVAIMVNEEDHLRIQVMEAGLQLMKAYEHAKKIDDAIEEKNDYAFSHKYGYLTACPTNVGTGLRASVMVHLPALTMTKKVQRFIRSIVQLGYTVRGLYGEGSSAQGNIYQISNQVTMGISEEETIEELTKVVMQLVKEEENCRKILLSGDTIALEDRVWRAFGVLKYARSLSSEEALSAISEMELGIDLGIIPKQEKYDFTKLLVITSPYFLQKYIGKKDLGPSERDKYRAQVIRDILDEQ